MPDETERANPFEPLRHATPVTAPAHPLPDPQQMLALATGTGFGPAPPVSPPQAPPVPPVSTQPEPISYRMPLRRATRHRRMTTGRDRQINIKATSEVVDRMQNLADDLNMPLGELLEHAIDYLEEHPPAAKRRR